MQRSRFLAVLLGVSAGGLAATAYGQSSEAAQPAPKAIYDEQADAKADIAAALAKAKRENQRVLVMFGGNWCGWCHKLHGLYKQDKEIARKLLYEYRLVLVDIGRWNKHMDVAESYKADLKKHGVPFLTILDADGKVIANQETGALEEGDHHDVRKVLEFLARHQAPPQDADKRLAAALAEARSDNKRVFLHLGAPWCGWCHKLEDFLARPEIAGVIARDYVDLKIDIDRMTGGNEVAARFRASDKGGIPWFAVLDADGKKLISSDGPEGNCGYPASPAEIAHFMKMLRETRRNITDEQLTLIEKALKEAAEKLGTR
ncbi:MAG: thioredoxin family protein [Phycisphaerae bacterium]|nr:thioredoxin family protein [Phycisphaerae bacterium]MCZ2398515.1 thioredoxin family protein [Phycisphaerae bacterium]NUQ50299.1 thioredoxin family protein [Phycisphaerae bacterium]